MHREIMHPPQGMEIDHINGNPLDNRKENLRICTHQQNQCNRTVQKNNKLGIKGVYWSKAHKKFQAAIRVNGEKIYLGLFSVLADAKQAYRIAELNHFREFAYKEVKK